MATANAPLHSTSGTGPVPDSRTLLAAIDAIERREIAPLIARCEWLVLIEICEVRDALAAGQHALFGIPLAKANAMLDWLRRSGWFCLDAERFRIRLAAAGGSQGDARDATQAARQ